MKTYLVSVFLLVGLLVGLLAVVACAPVDAPTETQARDRTVLPVPEPEYPSITELDARNAEAPPPFVVEPPEGAPNVVIVLIDDIGFGSASMFGGPIQTPTLDRLAQNGLRYNQFHTTALCSPTRMAILTGRNHHSANAGSVMEVATAFPGNQGRRPRSVAPLAEMLRLNGYSTAAFGKYHETAPWEVSVSGPFDRWPTHSGFDKFYGFIGGETNQWAPLIYDGTTKIEPPDDPDYHFTTDMDQPGDYLGPVSAIADAGQAVFYLLRDRRHPRTSSRAGGVDRQVRRRVRRRLGRVPRADAGTADRAGRGAAGHRARAQAGGHPRLGHPVGR